MTAIDNPRHDPDPTRPGKLHALEVRALTACRWCGEIPRARGTQFPELALYGWEEQGAAIVWDRWLFCSEAHYGLFHGGFRPRSR